MEQISRYSIFLAILVSITAGMIISCLFYCQATANDVGMVGAFFVHLIYCFIKALLISVGIILFTISSKIFKKKYSLYIILTSSLIITIFGRIPDIAIFIGDSWLFIILFYIIATYFLAIALLLVVPFLSLLNKGQ